MAPVQCATNVLLTCCQRVANYNEDGSYSMRVGPALFFITYIVIVAYTLLPVVVAVLLENFTTATRREKDLENRAELRRAALTQEV
jgi:hypothetical protein